MCRPFVDGLAAQHSRDLPRRRHHACDLVSTWLLRQELHGIDHRYGASQHAARAEDRRGEDVGADEGFMEGGGVAVAPDPVDFSAEATRLS